MLKVMKYQCWNCIDHLLRSHALVVAGEDLHEAVALLELVLHELGRHPVPLGAARQALEQAADDADAPLLHLRLAHALRLPLPSHLPSHRRLPNH